MNNNDRTQEKGICEILCVILVLQENACPDNCLQSCDRPVLGGGTNCLVCNTRPVMVYTCCGNGVPWSMPITKDSTEVCSGDTASETCSTVFRVEKIENGCVTFRVLAPNEDTTSTLPYVATNSFFSMNGDCICAIRCLSDTYVDCVC